MPPTNPQNAGQLLGGFHTEICALRDSKVEEINDLEQVKREAKKSFSEQKKALQTVVAELGDKKAVLEERKQHLTDVSQRQQDLRKDLEKQQEKLGTYKTDVNKFLDGVGGELKTMKALANSSTEGDAKILGEQLAAMAQKLQQVRAMVQMKVKNDETKIAHRASIQETDETQLVVNTVTNEITTIEQKRAGMFKEIEVSKAKVQEAEAALHEKVQIKENLDRKIKESEAAMAKIIASSSMLLNVIAQDKQKLLKSMPPVADPAKSRTQQARQEAAAALRSSSSPAGTPKRREPGQR